MEVEPVGQEYIQLGQTFSGLLNSQDPNQKKIVALPAAQILGEAVRFTQNHLLFFPAFLRLACFCHILASQETKPFYSRALALVSDLSFEADPSHRRMNLAKDDGGVPDSAALNLVQVQEGSRYGCLVSSSSVTALDRGPDAAVKYAAFSDTFSHAATNPTTVVSSALSSGEIPPHASERSCVVIYSTTACCLQPIAFDCAT